MKTHKPWLLIPMCGILGRFLGKNSLASPYLPNLMNQLEFTLLFVNLSQMVDGVCVAFKLRLLLKSIS